MLRFARGFSEKNESLSPSALMAHEPERDLNNALLSARPVDEPIELARDLMNAPFSAKLEADPTETLRYTVRPLNNELARLNESVKDLKNEYFWV